MKKTKKITELMKISCAQCGSCCCTPLVEVTNSDLRRLVKHTGMAADKLVKLYSGSEVNSDDEQDWIHLSCGKRVMGLRKNRNEECIFLSGERRCTVYEARPMSCRLFPINVVYNEEEDATDLELSDVVTGKFIKCRTYRGSGRSYNDFLSTVQRAEKEYETWCRKLRKWNRSGEKGGKNDFLKFLGLKTGTGKKR